MQINIGILGLGTVGCGTLNVLQRNNALIAQRAGCDLKVTRIATRTPDKERPVQFDPQVVSDDVDGFDTMYKLSILGSIAFSAPIGQEKIYREGIRKVGARDIDYARELGYVVASIPWCRSIPMARPRRFSGSRN